LNKKLIIKLLAIFLFSTSSLFLSPAKSQENSDYFKKEEIAFLKEALKYSDAKMWTEAFIEVEKTKNKNLKNLITWLKLRDGQGSFEEYSLFLKKNKDWPLIEQIKKTGEKTLTKKTSEEKVVAYFNSRRNCIELERISETLFRKFCLPRTANGSIRLLNTKKITNDPIRYNKILNNLVIRQKLSKDEFDYIMKNHNDKFEKLKYQRLEYFISNEHVNELKRLLNFLNKEHKSFLNLFLSLKEAKSKKTNAKIKKHQLHNESLAYERVSYLRRTGQYDKAQKVIREFSIENYEKLQDPRWLSVKQIYALRALRGGYGTRAYQIANTKYNYSDKPYFVSDFLYLEWLSGFIALEFLENPELAKKHFHNFLLVLSEWEEKNKILKKLRIRESIVSFDIAKARIGYWLGRVYEKLQDDVTSRKFYASSAQIEYTFYGQLSMERGRIKPKKNVLKMPNKKEKPNVSKNDLIDISLNLFFAERGVLGDYFAGEGSLSLSEKEKKEICNIFLEIGFTKAALTIAKKSTYEGAPIYDALFPQNKDISLKGDVDSALVLSVIRQESEFFRAAKSRTGALGLMQVMPSTAKEVSRKLKIKYVKRNLIIDENYNIRIGTFYLKYLLKRFEGSKILSLAAYNAGPGKLKLWIKKMGDPRKRGVDPLVWIELIPYPETRNYIKRVLEAHWFYKTKLEGVVSSPNLGKKYFGHQF